MINGVYLFTMDPSYQTMMAEVDDEAYELLKSFNVPVTSTRYDGPLIDAVKAGRKLTVEVVQEVIDIVDAQKFSKALIGEELPGSAKDVTCART